MHFRYDPASPLPPVADDESLALLGRARPDMVDELVAVVGALDGEFAKRLDQVDGLAAIREAMPILSDTLARRAIYADRHASLVRLLGLSAAPLPNAPSLPMPEVWRLSETHAQPAEVVRTLSVYASQAQRDLERAEAAVNQWSQTIGSDVHYQSLHDYDVKPERVYDQVMRLLSAGSPILIKSDAMRPVGSCGWVKSGLRRSWRGRRMSPSLG